MPTPSDPVDTLVVGAGIIGLSVARELAERGQRVLVLDRGAPGGGATRASGGMLAPVSEAEDSPRELLRFGLESLELYPSFVEGFSCGFDTTGTLWVATNRDEREYVERSAEILAERGLSPRRLSGLALRELEPHLSPRLVLGVRVEEDRQVDPRRLASCLVEALEERGGQVLRDHTVRGIETRGGQVCAARGETGGRAFELPCSAVVVAAGAFDPRELELPPRAVPGLRPVKGQLLRLVGGSLLRHVVRTPHVYLIPRAGDRLLVGATVEEVGHDLQATAGAVMDLLRRAWEVLPGIYDLGVEEVCVGLRSAVDDHRPVIGPAAVPRGLFLALGHYRNGILLAPATAKYLAQCIIEGRVPDALAPFVPTRLFEVPQETGS